MLEDIPEEYELDPETDLERIADIFLDRYPDGKRRIVEEAIFADEGPIDHLSWIVLDEYDTHEFFYYDSEPDEKVLRRLLSMSPSEIEMKLLRAYLAKRFDIVESIAHVVFFEIPDPYQPGRAPRANVALYQNPVSGEIDAGVNAKPISRELEVLDDVDRLVPASDLETFVENVVHGFFEELKETAKVHLIEGDVRSELEDDQDFRYQTTKPLPERLHPTYAGEDAELWQKPASKEPAIEASQGFVQVWVPENEQAAFVSMTDGDYDRQEALDAVRTSLESALA